MATRLDWYFLSRNHSVKAKSLALPWLIWAERDSQISFSTIHRRSAFWRGRPWFARQGAPPTTGERTATNSPIKKRVRPGWHTRAFAKAFFTALQGKL
jgi:hypothetical protein